MRKRMTCALAGLTLMVAAGGAQAAGAGFYVGAGLGKGEIADATTAVLDLESDTSFTGLVGYRTGIAPLFDFAIEGQYTDFGDFTPKTGIISGKAEGSMFAGSLLAILPIGPVDFYAKGGFSRLSFKSTIGGLATDKDSTNPAYGLGVGFRLPYLGLRLQADYVDTDKDIGDNLFMYSAIATFTF